MNQPITQLTPEQQALIPIIRDEWIKICLDTSPTDKEKAEASVRLAYECAGLTPPSQILWFNNPLEAFIYIVSQEKTLGKSAYDALLEPVNCFRLNDNRISKQLLYSIKEYEYIKHIYDNTYEEFLESIDQQVMFELIDEGYKIFRFPAWVTPDFISAISTASIILYAIYYHAIGVDCSELKGLWETAKHCGWWWPFQDIAILTPKPSAIRLDKEGRLHAEGLPAIAYQGYNIYAYHGVILPEKYGKVHPQNWQPQWLLKEKNAELRQLIIQIIGGESTPNNLPPNMK